MKSGPRSVSGRRVTPISPHPQLFRESRVEAEIIYERAVAVDAYFGFAFRILEIVAVKSHHRSLRRKPQQKRPGEQQSRDR